MLYVWNLQVMKNSHFLEWRDRPAEPTVQCGPKTHGPCAAGPGPAGHLFLCGPELSMVCALPFSYFWSVKRGEEIKSIILWHIKIIWHSNFSVLKFCSNVAMPTHLGIIYGIFITETVQPMKHQQCGSHISLLHTFRIKRQRENTDESFLMFMFSSFVSMSGECHLICSKLTLFASLF